jgi:hypothetical protein
MAASNQYMIENTSIFLCTFFIVFCLLGVQKLLLTSWIYIYIWILNLVLGLPINHW